MLSPPRIRDTELIIVRGAQPRQVSLRGPSKPVRLIEAKSPPARAEFRFQGLPTALIALALMLVWTLWQWHKAREEAEAARLDLDISWSFADQVLDDLQSMRGDAQRLDEDRKGLIARLSQSEKDRVHLRSELNEWREQHDELATHAQQVAGQWASYSEDLKRNLGTARADLGEVSQALHSERTTAQQQISSLSDEKSAIEREAVAFSHKASSLESDNRQMENEISRQNSAISSLQSENSRLESCNSSLRSENSRLQCEVSRLISCVSSLESRVRCLESELSQTRGANRTR